MLTSGLLLADRYLLTSRIAVGGMGEVWKAEDTRLDRRVAVKVLKPELCGDEEFLHRFRTEARTTASLNHPSIAAVHDYGETTSPADPGEDAPRDTAYLVMELVEGEPLSAIISREGRVGPELTMDVLEQAGNALQAAHERGYVHRDVKPGNILIVPGNPVIVKLTDFGIAKAADAVPVTRSGMVMGTAHYVAPEMAVGQEAEPASDVYSLAVVGYECLVGHRPFLSENAVTVAMMHIRDLPPPLPPDVPPGLRALVESTLTKDPRQRYASGGEFAAAVAAVRAGAAPPPPAGLTSAGLRPVPVPQQQQPVGAPTPGYQAHHLAPNTTPTRAQPPFPGQLVGHPPMPGQTSGPISGPASGPVVPGYPTPSPVRPGGGRPWLWVVFALVLVALLALGALLAPRVFGASKSHEVANVRFATPTETAADALTALEQGMMDRNFMRSRTTHR